DELLYVIAADRLAGSHGQRPPELAGVAGTLMTNLAIERALRERGFDFVRAKVGDRYVLEELQRRGWLLGGEGSGHLVILDKHTTGDGLISALQVLQACTTMQRTLAQLLAEVLLYPQVMLNVRLPQGSPDWRENTRLKTETEAVQTELGAQGRVLIRASGTEPLLRVMVEAADPMQARRCAERLAAVV
ncbi:MAG: phosphoglucosamine mutase, partial [Burkholderiaceae bacterium]|nr:phosphoglucosamine mutase [Burkholderiaceae bacterium]